MKETREVKSKTIAVFSTKGGVGKTVIASNLAALLSNTDKKVALLDLNLHSGDVALSMNIVSGMCINDLAEVMDKLDIKLLESFMVRHDSGVMVLPAPLKPEFDEGITANHIKKILDILSEEFDHIIIDCPPILQDRVLMVLDISDIILLVTSMDLLSIKNAKNCINALEEAGYGNERLKLVINRVFYGSEIGKRDIAAAIGLPVTAALPQEDRVVIGSINQGVPAVFSYKRSKFSKGMRKLAERLTDNIA